MRFLQLRWALCVGLVWCITMAGSALGDPISTADPNDNNDPHNADYPRNSDISFANNLVSVSSDGHYAVTSNLANQIILWDLKNHTQKVISNHANSYSAYFIKNSPYFMWQELPANQLEFATSEGKPPIDKLQLVAQNKLGIISEEDKKFYVYFCGNLDKINTLGAVVKKPLPKSINNNFLMSKLHDGDHFDLMTYVDRYNLVTDLTSQMRFIEVLISLGYQSGNIVHVQDVSGKEVLHFDNFPVYGQVMRSNLKDYFASSFNWNVYQGYGAKQKLIMIDDGGFYGGKLLNLTLSDAKPLLLTSGDASDLPYKLVRGANSVLGNFQSEMGLSRVDGVVLWNTTNGQPLHLFYGNKVKTYATLSPDGNYVLAGDENTNLYVWDTKTYKRLEDWSMAMGIAVAWKNDIATKFDTTGLIKQPDNFHDSQGIDVEAVFSIQFVDHTHYLRFTLGTPYAVLFSVHNPKPLKYFFLGNLNPAIYDYSQDQALDASPSAHILVMAMSGQRGGILEYQYDPKAMTLKRVWIGHLVMPPIAYGEVKSKDKDKKSWLF